MPQYKFFSGIINPIDVLIDEIGCEQEFLGINYLLYNRKELLLSSKCKPHL